MIDLLLCLIWLSLAFLYTAHLCCWLRAQGIGFDMEEPWLEGVTDLGAADKHTPDLVSIPKVTCTFQTGLFNTLTIAGNRLPLCCRIIDEEDLDMSKMAKITNCPAGLQSPESRYSTDSLRIDTLSFTPS